jgi:uncharacterized repeat protein (TIGR03943 family)
MVAAVTRQTQALVLSTLGGLLLRLGISDEHLRYVNAWMRWPLVATGALVIALSLAHLFGSATDEDDHAAEHEHRVPRTSWLLLAPFLVVFLVAPQPLGSFVADRRSNRVVADPISYFSPLPKGAVVPMTVTDFVVRAQYDDAGTLTGRPVELTGFVSQKGDDWFVSRISINCCAADAMAYRVRAVDAEMPPVDSWVTVVGTWVPPESAPSADEAPEDPALAITSLVPIEAPRQPYE